VRAARNEPSYLFELRFTGLDRQSNRVLFELSSVVDLSIATFALRVGGEGGFKVEQLSGKPVFIGAGARDTASAG
jgi:hypothetical protein